MAGDERNWCRLARVGIAHLNQKSESHRADIFFLVHHRPRRWKTRQEGVWMGYERKRGKLSEFNAICARRALGCFDQDRRRQLPHVAPRCSYAITLDTDTQLPRDSVRAMVGAMAHPLNRPVFDPERGRVVDGYGILQPRVGASLPSSQRRSGSKAPVCGRPGSWTSAHVRRKDLYQDLFGEGSFVGKGIYDVDAFEQSCGAFPENTILSHDLLEGAHARSGLLSDVELFDDFPSSYPTDISRRHRWIRGDWQIAWWLLPWVSGRGTQRKVNPISVLSWWKILDNPSPQHWCRWLCWCSCCSPGCWRGRLWETPQSSSCWRWSGPSRCWPVWKAWCASQPISP